LPTVEDYTILVGQRRAGAGSLSAIRGAKIWRKPKKIWMARKPLKSHKMPKTFLGKAWHWNHTSLEMFGKKAWRALGGASALRPFRSHFRRFARPQ
jgi:hypothetical protein